MVARLIELKPYIVEFPAIYNNHDWEFAENFIKVFTPVDMITDLLKLEQFIMGDFYLKFLEMKLKVNQMNTPLANSLKLAIEKQQSSLLENDSILAALYLDPRIHCSLTVEQKNQARIHLNDLLTHMEVNHLVEFPSQPDDSNSSMQEALGYFFSTSEDILEAHLSNFESASRNLEVSRKAKVIEEIWNYLPSRLHSTANVSLAVEQLKFGLFNN